MPKPIVVVGMGQLGAVFSEAFLKLGHPVVPVLRGGNLAAACQPQDPAAILVATGEDDLGEVLSQIPTPYGSQVVLIQNELRPDQWLRHSGISPSLAIVWFEKKKGKAPHVVLPSVLFGEAAPLLKDCFDALDIPAKTVDTHEELAHELVLKNLYILGLNLAGLTLDGVAGSLLSTHQEQFDALVAEILMIEKALLKAAPPFSQVTLDEPRLRHDLSHAIEADPNHGCAGRSAPRRLERTLAHGKRVGVSTPLLSALVKEPK